MSEDKEVGFGQRILNALEKGMDHVEKGLSFVDTPDEAEETGDEVTDAEFVEHKTEPKLIASETQSKMTEGGVRDGSRVSRLELTYSEIIHLALAVNRRIEDLSPAETIGGIAAKQLTIYRAVLNKLENAL
jgi:hypothetical protein